ncbi:hypothetical protein QJS04_geneDACA003541 [Acorus gramineus]|uniref:SUN domain-containing protein n=1 Tax=Acorus gramineus TaxID=55184 RepID=A0AAV9BLT2_ACOGR|nr:hypothetical protein QJS04_geneDACA003541 [Acorus gramineus]
MSSSTAPLSDSNPRQTVKKKAVTVELRRDVEIYSAEGVHANSVDAVLANGRDLINRARVDPSQARRNPVNSTVLPQRRKPRPEKSRWETIVSILAKNSLLCLALLFLWKSAFELYNGFSDKPVPLIPALDFEGRVADVEKLVKTSAKMTQVQLDAMGAKVDDVMGSFRRELMRIEDAGGKIESELRELTARTENLNKSLGALGGSDLLSKEEYDLFLEEFKRVKSVEGFGGGSSLDVITAVAREIVMKEIEKHAADGLGRVDYALGPGGAWVVRHSKAFICKRSWIPTGPFSVHPDAQKMLEPSFGEPGKCFALNGSSGFVEIKLKTGIIPEAVTLEHVAKSVAFDRSTAPRDCRVSAWFEGLEDKPSVRDERMFPLLEFTYDLGRSNAQTFDIDISDSGLINMVRLDITSNHGNPDYTCVYRFRVHGHEPDHLFMNVVDQ